MNAQDQHIEFWSNLVHATWIPTFMPFTEKVLKALDHLKGKSLYTKAHSDGYHYRSVVVRNAKDPRIKAARADARCFVRMPDLFSPFCMVPKPMLRVLIITGPPNNTGIATGVPFLYGKDRYDDAYIYGPSDGKNFLDKNEVNAIEECLIRSPTGTGSVTRYTKTTNTEYDMAPRGYSVRVWMDQGVMPIHSIPTSDEIMQNAHVDAWRPIMKEIIYDIVSDNADKLAVVILGDIAKGVSNLLTDPSIIYAPSPGECRTPQELEEFIRVNPFKRANELLTARGMQPILW